MNKLLKSILAVSLMCFACLSSPASYAGEATKAPVAKAPTKPATSGLTWIKKKFILPNPPAGFSVNFDYPSFAGQPTDTVSKLNNAMQAELMKQAKAAAKDYSDFVSGDLPISKEAKKKKDGSSIGASFVVHKTTDNIVSVSFATCSYYFGMAHPVNNYFVFNTQLSPFVSITLANLTTNQKKFLQIVSAQCAQKIKKLLQYPNPDIIAEGTAPTAENFQNFVLMDKQIGFYFNDAQASIHAEPIEKPIGVPYHMLTAVLNPDCPVQ